ncbi:MAG: hypothetical protein IJI67_05950 [Clostridia bacterium]|nr:hypothetical protein [Clostridia bacterium]
MNNIDHGQTENIYAALKLIEQLYTDGFISEYMFLSILDKYKFQVDISSFKTKRDFTKEKGDVNS